MKFKTLRSSESGQKLQQIEKEMQICREAQIKLSKEIGFQSWRQAYWVAFGGISCVHFKESVDASKWKKVDDGVYPKRNTRAGKSLEKKFATLPCVTIESLNHAVGFTEKVFKTVGVNFKNSQYYLFSVGEDWGYVPPEDCIEITNSEYEELQK